MINTKQTEQPILYIRRRVPDCHRLSKRDTKKKGVPYIKCKCGYLINFGEDDMSEEDAIVEMEEHLFLDHYDEIFAKYITFG